MSDRVTSTTSSPWNSPPAFVTVAVRVIPRAARDRLDGWRQGRLLVRTTAPPLQGRANDAVRALIADALGLAPSAVEVIRGAQTRDKLLRVRGRPQRDLLRALGHPDYV